MILDEKIQAADEVIHHLIIGLYSDQTHETYDTMRSDAKEGIQNVGLPKFYHIKYNEIIDDEVGDCELQDEGGLSE